MFQALPSPFHRRLCASLFASAYLAATPALASEALDIELPSMSTPLSAPGDMVPSEGHRGGVSRTQVREELRQARAAGTLTEAGENGDSPAVLQARERFNAAQAEAIRTDYRLALADAESRRAAWRAQDSARRLASAESDFDDEAEGDVMLVVSPAESGPQHPDALLHFVLVDRPRR